MILGQEVDRLRTWVVRHLPRWLAVALGLRRLSPDFGQRPPGLEHVHVLALTDTGGGVYRPPHRRQDPSKDPEEPGPGDNSSEGDDHAWNGCTMSAGSMALGWHWQGGTPWGGHLRHSGQPDMTGGTDLYDLQDAWDEYGGADLKIKSGQGWDAVQDAREAWRAIVLQGSGNVPGSGTYTGAHAVVVLPERHSSGDWLMGDPLVTGGASGYQWVPEAKLKAWAQAFSSGIAFAVSQPHDPNDVPPEPPEPIPPEPVPVPPEPPPGPIHQVRGPRASWSFLGAPAGLSIGWGEQTWGDGSWDAAWGVWGPVWAWPAATPAWDAATWLAPWAE